MRRGFGRRRLRGEGRQVSYYIWIEVDRKERTREREGGRGGRTHDRLGSTQPPIRDNSTLRKHRLLHAPAPAVVNADLDLLHHEDDGADISELIVDVALSEHVFEVVVEAVVLLVHDEDLVGLGDYLLLETVIDDLHLLLLDLDDGVLGVEGVEVVDEGEVGGDGAAVGGGGRGQGDGGRGCGKGVSARVSLCNENRLTCETCRER